MKVPTVALVSKGTKASDPHFEDAARRAALAAQRLRDAGIVDAEGRRVRKDTPDDMQSSDADFGG